MRDTLEQNIAVYIRTTPFDSSFDEQKKAILDFISARGLIGTLVFYVDRENNRDGFKALKKAITHSKVTSLLCWKFDRMDLIADSIEETFLFMKLIEEHKVTLTSILEGFSTANPSDIFTRISGMISDAKHSLKTERLKWSLSEATKAGRHIGRPVTVDRKEVLELRANGHSIRNIALTMGISPTTVQATLKAEVIQTLG